MRLIICAFPFILFSLIGIFGNIIFIPIIILRLNKYKKVQYFCRNLVRYSWKFFLKIISLTGYIKHNFKPIIFNESGTLLIANHPSLLDVVYFLANIKNLNCVVKKKLGSNIVLFGAIKACGYIINSNNEQMLQKSIYALQSGENLLIFPEGTRTNDKIIFHKAASYIAINGAKRVKCIFIHIMPKALRKNESWKQLPKIIVYNFVDGCEIIIKEFYNKKHNTIKVRKLHDTLSKIYEKEFNNGN